MNLSKTVDTSVAIGVWTLHMSAIQKIVHFSANHVIRIFYLSYRYTVKFLYMYVYVFTSVD